MVKVIATISPNTEKLSGVDLCRINCSFGTVEEILALSKKITQEWGLPLLLDLPLGRKKRRTNYLSFEEMVPLVIEAQPDYIAISYVRDHQQVIEFREHFSETNAKILAKVETSEALDDLDKIIQYSDIIMIDRGDLSDAIGKEKLPRMQKRIVKKCNEQNKQVIVATEFLMSMIDQGVPTRAEVSDIGNAISAGADYIMLSEETAIGQHPQKAVEVIKDIIDEMEDNYKVVILSAGPSLGMGPLTAEYHTSLVDIGGTTILETQLKALEECGVYDEDIIIATGKGDALIREFVQEKLQRKDINFVYNPWYESTNMLVSIWLAREFIQKGFIVIYGDIVFEPEILKRIIKSKKAISLAVERKVCDQEAEKLCVSDGKMVLSKNYERLPFPKHKNIPADQVYGEFVGIAKFSRWGSIVLVNEMDQIIRKSDLWAYLVQAFEHLSSLDYELSVEDVTGLIWSDNDTTFDLNETRLNILPKIQEKFDSSNNFDKQSASEYIKHS